MAGLPESLHLAVNTLALKRGGLVKAVITRANELVAAEPGRPVVIEVLAAQTRLAEDVATMVEGGHLDPRVHVRSILRCLDPAVAVAGDDDPVLCCVHHPPAPAEARPVVAPSIDDRLAISDPSGRATHFFSADGVLERIERFDQNGALRHLDHFTVSRERFRREEFDTGGRLARVVEFPPGSATPTVQRWMGRDGRCYLVIWQEPETATWTNAFTMNDRRMLSIPALYRLAFERALHNHANPVLFSEFRDQLPSLPAGGLDEVVVAVRHPSVRRVAVVHSCHTYTGRDGDDTLTAPWEQLLTGLDRWDLLVVATDRQRTDIARSFGHAEQLRAIPHFVTGFEGAAAAPVEGPRFVLVARIHRKKRVDEALAVFALVAGELPDARLDIYGFGYGDELEERVVGMVEELGLTERVHFRGFRKDVGAIYRGACATLQTSESEGFGMSITESLACGVPVVAYDVRYGPREVIRDGVDGFIVPWGDREAMAERLVRLSRDAELRASMGAAGPRVVERLSRESYVRSWEDAIGSLPVRAGDGPPQAPLVTVTLLGIERSTVILKRRSGEVVAEAPVFDGVAEFTAPHTSPGEILDVYVRRAGGRDVRAEFRQVRAAAPAPLVPYATSRNMLSIKHRPQPRDPAALSPVAPRTPARLRRYVATRLPRLSTPRRSGMDGSRSEAQHGGRPADPSL